MTATFIVLGLVALAFVIFTLWNRGDARKEARAAAELADVAALGDDLLPTSIHPTIDPNRCIGSGACVTACPEHDVIGVVNGRAELLNPLACVGHGACAEACPVKAIDLVFGTEKRGVELPRIDPNFQTTRPGVYVVGELAGMGLIRNAVNQGRQAAEHIISTGRRGGGDVLDAVVVGAGPAGISAALRLQMAGYQIVVLDREAFGGTIMHYPRAKVVMTGALDLPGYGTVRRSTMTKEQLVDLWRDIEEKSRLPFRSGELVEGLSPEPDGSWRVQSTSGEHLAATVVLALGRRGSPRKLDVPGEGVPRVAYRVLEPREFHGQHVLVVGGGNSAVESAIALVDHGECASVSISYRRTAFARCRAANRQRIDDLIATKKVHAFLPSEVERIDPEHVILRVDGTKKRIPNDRVVIQIGGTTPSDVLKTFGIETITKFAEA